MEKKLIVSGNDKVFETTRDKFIQFEEKNIRKWWEWNGLKLFNLFYIELSYMTINIITISLMSIFFQDKSRVWTAAFQQH